MRYKHIKTIISTFAIILLLTVAISCLRAKPPGQQQQPPDEPNEAMGPPPEVTPEVVEHSIPIDAGVAGKEYSFQDVRFTHLAIEADESMEWPVAVAVNLNEEYLGIFYADGWGDESEQKLHINPGDISKWVLIRGSWLKGENLLKLKFITPSIGGMEIPARYFKGTLYLKNDIEAWRKEMGDEEPEEEEPSDEEP
jgi:hypothetical protein